MAWAWGLGPELLQVKRRSPCREVGTHVPSSQIPVTSGHQSRWAFDAPMIFLNNLEGLG